MASDRQWAGSTYGGNRLHRSLVNSLKFMDVRLVYAGAAIFVIPFCLIFNRSRKTSWRFYRDRMGCGRARAAWMVYLNHLRFAEVIVDRFAMYAGKNFDVRVEGVDHFNTLAAGEEGFIQLSSHIGNYEMAGYSLVSDRKVINAVVYEGEKESVMQGRSSMFERTNIHMITLRSDMSHLFEIDRAICEGNIVSFPSDRAMGEARTVECDFLGAQAGFPMGPFSVAAMRGLKVLAVNVMKTGAKKYTIYVTPLPYDTSLPRRQQVADLSRAYVAELEKRVRQYPEQWFNFFDFWK